jgi:hypothetical protein
LSGGILPPQYSLKDDGSGGIMAINNRPEEGRMFDKDGAAFDGQKTIDVILKPDTSLIESIPSVEIGANIKPIDQGAISPQNQGDYNQLTDSIQSNRIEQNLNPENGRMFNNDGTPVDSRNSIFSGNNID